MSSKRGQSGLGIGIPDPSPISGPIPNTHFFGESESPIGADQLGFPIDRVKFPCLLQLSEKGYFKMKNIQK